MTLIELREKLTVCSQHLTNDATVCGFIKNTHSIKSVFYNKLTNEVWLDYEYPVPGINLEDDWILVE